MYRTEPQRTDASAQSVASATFGKMYPFPVDGQTYAQPLVKANLTIPGKVTSNTVFVATEQSSIYAIDADSGTPIWHRNFTNPATGLTVRTATSTQDDIRPAVSIMSTPVIDAVHGTLYVVAVTGKRLTRVLLAACARCHDGRGQGCAGAYPGQRR